mgnify:CR=1 FL=1
MAKLKQLPYDVYSEVLSFLHPDLYTILPTFVEHRTDYRNHVKQNPKYRQSELLEFVDYFEYYEILPKSNLIIHTIKHKCNNSFMWLLENNYKVNDKCLYNVVDKNDLQILKILRTKHAPIHDVLKRAIVRKCKYIINDLVQYKTTKYTKMIKDMIDNNMNDNCKGNNIHINYT